MASQIPYLDVQNLTKRFGAQVLFDNISFSIAEGQKVGLVARNGTGKSTLMSVLMDKEGHEASLSSLQFPTFVPLLCEGNHREPAEQRGEDGSALCFFVLGCAA